MDAKAKSKPPKLDDLDLSHRLGNGDYDRKLDKLRHKLMQIQQAYLFSGQSGVIVFEGWDAAGKGGTIRRISSALDPRSFKVWPIGPPRPYYLDRHFLLRFMERLPPRGAISAFDRSWYGRVLVERVEELAPEDRWKAAYREINEFERMIVDDGVRLVKLFFHISPDEQAHRFEERLRNPMKRWKLSYEDFRNRRRWEDYASAIDEMFQKTSTDYAPWNVIPANDKKYARVAALKAIVDCFGHGVELSPPTLDDALISEACKHLDIKQSLIDSLAGRTE
jgi:polyphosphate kinase 2 (PPK2 family)